MTNQIWTIGGRQYTWSQLQQLKQKKLDAKTAEIVFVKPEGAEKIYTDIKKFEEKSKNEESTGNVEGELSYPEMKKLAKEKGMQMTPQTKKTEIIEFLNTNS